MKCILCRLDIEENQSRVLHANMGSVHRKCRDIACGTPPADPRDAEIQRLKAELEFAKRTRMKMFELKNGYRARAETAEAQVERLTKALNRLGSAIAMGSREDIIEANRAARSALAPTTAEGEHEPDEDPWCVPDQNGHIACDHCRRMSHVLAQGKATPPAREEKECRVDPALLPQPAEPTIPRAVAVEAVGLLRWLDNGGGLGLEVHSRLRSVEKKLRAALGLP